MKLFVYGTLMKGQTLHPMIESAVESVTPAKVKGDLYSFYDAYPVAFLGGHNWIKGEILECDDMDRSLYKVIDMECGAGYRPVYTTAFVGDGCRIKEEEVVAFNFMDRNVPVVARVPDGDWAKYKA